MDVLRGIRNANGGTGAPQRLGGQLADILRIDQARRKQTRAEALVKAWEFVWGLPRLNPRTDIKWVGVDSPIPEALGKARVAVSEQEVAPPFDFLPAVVATQPQKSGVKESSFESLGFGALVAGEEGFEGLPIPLLARGKEAFSESGLAAYPIRRQGFLGREAPTQRVHTLEAYLAEKNVWPENYRWLIPYIPVYHLTAFVPLPREGATDAASFNPDYCFGVEGSRGLIVHRIIEDRILPGYIYTKPSKGLFESSGLSAIALTDVQISEEGAEPKYCLFRAERAPTLNMVRGAAEPTVFGRFIFIVMQQPAPKPISLGDKDGGDSLTLGMKPRGAEVLYTTVGAGRQLEPVSYGKGVAVDPLRLPTIFDVRVLGVRETDEVSEDVLDQGATIIPFSS